MRASEIRQKFLDFFAARGHKAVPSSSLVPADPSVLLTTAGMQQFKPYYTGDADPEKNFGARNTVSVQKCFRTTDIDEVGDDTHLTFFEMLGNFSFGGYGKKEAVTYAYEFITQELKLPIAYVTVFGGDSGAGVPADEESAAIWRSLDSKLLVKKEGMADVFWGPTGNAGPCGPTTEIYCENAAGETVEIWNIVFNQFFYNGSREDLLAGAADKKLEPLAPLGIDTGMGLERLAMIVQKTKNIFETDLFDFTNLLRSAGEHNLRPARIIADHLRGTVFLLADGVRPSNKGAGYILRRIIRRLIVQANRLSLPVEDLKETMTKAINEYGPFGDYKKLIFEKENIMNEFWSEVAKFETTLGKGLKEFARRYPAPSRLRSAKISGREAFDLYQTYGLTLEIIKDLARDSGQDVDESGFNLEFAKHQDVSRAGLDKKFTGGLANHELPTIKLHTAHHLLLAALKQVLGTDVKQRGSNINEERLRLDFGFGRKLTDDEKQKVEQLVNEKIEADLPVTRQEMPKTEAEKLGAEMEFGAKYGDTVSVYTIGEGEHIFSREFCGGPHVASTGEIGGIKILKEEPTAAGVRRIKAKLLQG